MNTLFNGLKGLRTSKTCTTAGALLAALGILLATIPAHAQDAAAPKLELNSGDNAWVLASAALEDPLPEHEQRVGRARIRLHRRRRGPPSDFGDLVASYQEILRGADYSKLDWPRALLPFCEWGCNIFSCVDCRDKTAPVSRSEECAAQAEGYTLTDFLTMWVDGVGLLDLNPGERATREIVNPFTGTKARVTGGCKPRR